MCNLHKFIKLLSKLMKVRVLSPGYRRVCAVVVPWNVAIFRWISISWSTLLIDIFPIYFEYYITMTNIRQLSEFLQNLTASSTIHSESLKCDLDHFHTNRTLITDFLVNILFYRFKKSIYYRLSIPSSLMRY